MRPGSVTQSQFAKLRSTWRQGEHMVISGGTGSGKTTLGRLADEVRLDAGGSVVVLICKPGIDKTVTGDYTGWTRWTDWKKNPSKHDRRILLWPDTKKCKTPEEVKAHHREVFGPALDRIFDQGKWCVDLDEGFYMMKNSFMNMGEKIEMMHALGRSNGITMITKMQRPSDVPLIIYGSASHAYVGRTREANDLKRLSEMGGRHSAKELAGRISSQGRHDFLWIPITPDWEPEIVNVRR